MSRSVDDVYDVIIPLTGGAGRGDGYAALLFLRQIVHGGRAVMNFPHPMDFPGIEQHAFGQRGLACVDVRDDADIAQLRERAHGRSPGGLTCSFGPDAVAGLHASRRTPFRFLGIRLPGGRVT